MIWLKIWACHDSHSLFFGYLITLMWILFGRHGLFLTDLCIHSMVILPLSGYVVSWVECFFVWQLTQLQKENEELRQQGRELRPEGNTHGMLQSEAEHLREVLALSLWSLEMTVS